jgi:hypothetical protein
MADLKSTPLTQEEARTLLFALRYQARKAVEAHWRAEGRKPQYIEPKELRLASEAWLTDHYAELLPRAQELVSYIRTSAQRKKRSNHSRIPVQISGAK